MVSAATTGAGSALVFGALATFGLAALVLGAFGLLADLALDLLAFCDWIKK